MPISAITTTPAQTTTRTSIRCSSRIFFTLASRSGTSRIVYDLSKEPPERDIPYPTHRARCRFPVSMRSLRQPASSPDSSPVSVGGGSGQYQTWASACLLDPLHRHHCNVVVAAAGIGQLDELLRHFRQLGLYQGVADLLGLDQVGEAVRAEQELVARAGLDAHHVDQNVLLEAHRAGNDVLQPAVLCLVGREQAGADLLVDQRVVLGELPDVLAAHQVDAAVADVADQRLAVLEQERAPGGA